MAARCWTQISAISVCQATSKPNSPLSCPSSHLQRRRQLSTGQQGGLLDEPLVHAARWCHVPATKQWAVGQWEVGSQAERGGLDSSRASSDSTNPPASSRHMPSCMGAWTAARAHPHPVSS